jgi:hypothetical protein
MPAKPAKRADAKPAKAVTSGKRHPLDPRENPLARDRRGTASRDEIRRKASATQHSARQSQRNPERGSQHRTHRRVPKKPAF